VRHAVVSDASREPERVRQLGHESGAGSASVSAAWRGSNGEIQQVAAFELATSPVAATSISHTRELRVPLPWPPASYDAACPPGCPPGLACPPGVPCPTLPYTGPYPEEFLCDGGDSGDPVHYHGPQELHGLEHEDTVAEYRDHLGERHVKPSTRVCVYAPRFAAVRSATQPIVDVAVEKAAGAHEGLTLAGLHRRQALDTQEQADQLHGLLMRERPSGLDVDAGDSSLHALAKVEAHLKITNPFQDFAFVRDGQFRHAAEPYLAYAIQFAGVWSRDLNPMIMARDENGHELTARFFAEEYVGAEDRRPPGELRIVKLADRQTARSGDVVTFTIRFDNLGGRELTQVRIVDHLTTRLEYVPGSVVCELEGRLNVEDHVDGSQVLTFQLAQPLEGQMGGAITFECRVR
jgi:uncharacterized repeat protein (TIGR01451 family)